MNSSQLDVLDVSAGGYFMNEVIFSISNDVTQLEVFSPGLRTNISREAPHRASSLMVTLAASSAQFTNPF